jgi:hypothetical protein
MITTYLSEFYSGIPTQKKLVQYLNLLPTESNIQNYGTLLNSTMSEIIAWQEKTEAFKNKTKNSQPEKAFPMEMGDLKNLENVFTKIKSNNIKKLLQLLDHSKPKVRRLMLLLFQILLKSKSAKKKMVDKCGISTGNGLFLLTRLKDLVWDNENEVYLFLLLKEINVFIKNIESTMLKDKIVLKGTFVNFLKLQNCNYYFIKHFN